MNEKEIAAWLTRCVPKHEILTGTVVQIISSLLKNANIDYLTVSGRTKKADSIREKIKRKSYFNPETQMTDISGIRIIAYFESDVKKISDLIEKSFNIDIEHSLPKNSLLANDQIGYRSVHYVADLGEQRAILPEFKDLNDLKFEFQIRTVMQHAWAELAHDRNYKFSGKLPREIERMLYLYSGMLEIADKGFDQISQQIDEYIHDFNKRTTAGDYDIEINSISLEEFLEKWTKDHGFYLEPVDPLFKSDHGELVSELKDLGVDKISDLIKIIPADYFKIASEIAYKTNMYGLLRDWMLVHDFKKYHDEVGHNWSGFDSESVKLMSKILTEKEMQELYDTFKEYDFFPSSDGH